MSSVLRVNRANGPFFVQSILPLEEQSRNLPILLRGRVSPSRRPGPSGCQVLPHKLAICFWKIRQVSERASVHVEAAIIQQSLTCRMVEYD